MMSIPSVAAWLRYLGLAVERLLQLEALYNPHLIFLSVRSYAIRLVKALIKSKLHTACTVRHVQLYHHVRALFKLTPLIVMLISRYKATVKALTLDEELKVEGKAEWEFYEFN